MTFISFSKVKGIKYYSIYEKYRENGKEKRRIVKYLGNIDKIMRDHDITKISLEDIKIDQILNHGEILILYKLLSELDLEQKVNALMPKTRGNGIDVGRLTEIMVINALTVQKSKDKIKDWYEETSLPKLLQIDPDHLYAELFCRTLDYFTGAHIETLEKQITSALQKRYQFEITRVFYDITSVYLEGDKCPLAEFGYSRDGKRKKKQVVLGLVIMPNEKFPLLYKVYRGNTADVATSKEVLNQLYTMYAIYDAIIIVDRGMISDKVRVEFKEMNVRYITALDECSKEARDLILGVPYSQLGSLTLTNGREVRIKRLLGSIKSLRKEFGRKHCSRKEFTELDDIPFLYVVGKSPEISKVKKTKHHEAISRALEELKNFQQELDAKSSLSNKKGRPIDVDARLKQILHGVTKYFQISWSETGAPIKLTVTFKKENLRIARKVKGRFVLCASDPSLTTSEIVQGYIDKYQIEHAFRFLKTDIDVRPFWHRKPNRIIAYFFISYLAYLLKSIIDFEFKKSRLNMSFIEAMEELGKLKIVSISTGQQQIEKLREISPMQEIIFKSLKINLSV